MIHSFTDIIHQVLEGNCTIREIIIADRQAVPMLELVRFVRVTRNQGGWSQTVVMTKVYVDWNVQKSVALTNFASFD